MDGAVFVGSIGDISGIRLARIKGKLAEWLVQT